MLLFPNKNRTADQSLSPLSNLIKSMQTNLTGKKGQLYKMHSPECRITCQQDKFDKGDYY